jgi:hypothetical protein
MTDEEIFCLRYETEEEIRVLNIICSNAKGVYEAISAAFSEVKGEGKGSTPKLEKKVSKKKKKPKASEGVATPSDSISDDANSKRSKKSKASAPKDD